MRDWRKTLVSSVEYMKLFFNEDQFHRFIFFTLLVSSAFTRQNSCKYYFGICIKIMKENRMKLVYLLNSDPLSKSPHPPPTERPVVLISRVLKYDILNGLSEAQFLTSLVAESCSREVDTTFTSLKESLIIIMVTILCFGV